MGNVRFNWNMDNFKFNFLSRGQLESLNLDKTFLPLFKILPYWEVTLVTKFLPLLLECCAEIILIVTWIDIIMWANISFQNFILVFKKPKQNNVFEQ